MCTESHLCLLRNLLQANSVEGCWPCRTQPLICSNYHHSCTAGSLAHFGLGRRIACCALKQASAQVVDNLNIDALLMRCDPLPAGALAVHCKAGLGRTGVLICSYMIKHHGFTAEEAIGYIRICRPGSVIGLQQNYLIQMHGKLVREGQLYRQQLKSQVRPGAHRFGCRCGVVSLLCVHKEAWRPSLHQFASRTAAAPRLAVLCWPRCWPSVLQATSDVAAHLSVLHCSRRQTDWKGTVGLPTMQSASAVSPHLERMQPAVETRGMAAQRAAAAAGSLLKPSERPA